MPTFVLGLLLLLVFYYELTIHGIHFFPATYIPFGQSPSGWFRSLILPWFTLALVSAATYTRLTRGSMLDVMNEDYIRTARAKGLSERRVIFRHSLRAALTPIVTQFGLDVGILLGGAVITEVVFSMPGLGYTAVQSIDQQDLPVIIGVVIVASTAVVVANIVVDAFYAVLDPRVRLSSGPIAYGRYGRGPCLPLAGPPGARVRPASPPVSTPRLWRGVHPGSAACAHVPGDCHAAIPEQVPLPLPGSPASGGGCIRAVEAPGAGRCDVAPACGESPVFGADRRG